MLDNRTVVRLGLGPYFQRFPGQLVRDLSVGGGVYQTNYTLIPNQVNSPVFPKPLAATSSVSTSLQNSLVTFAKSGTPYPQLANRQRRFLALSRRRSPVAHRALSRPFAADLLRVFALD